MQAKIASLDDAGFYDPFHAERARQGADKMNNISKFSLLFLCILASSYYTRAHVEVAVFVGLLSERDEQQ
jgi:hypothetical protein